MQNIYSERTRKEAQEIIREAKREEKREKFNKNIPYLIGYVGILVVILTYAVSVNNQYNEMRERIANDRQLPMSIRKQYMTEDELNNVMYNPKN